MKRTLHVWFLNIAVPVLIIIGSSLLGGLAIASRISERWRIRRSRRSCARG